MVLCKQDNSYQTTRKKQDLAITPLCVILNNHTAQHRKSLTDRAEDCDDIHKLLYNLDRLH